MIASALNNLARPEDAGRHVDDRPERDEEEDDEARGVRVSTKFDNVRPASLEEREAWLLFDPPDTLNSRLTRLRKTVDW